MPADPRQAMVEIGARAIDPEAFSGIIGPRGLPYQFRREKARRAAVRFLDALTTDEALLEGMVRQAKAEHHRLYRLKEPLAIEDALRLMIRAALCAPEKPGET